MSTIVGVIGQIGCARLRPQRDLRARPYPRGSLSSAATPTSLGATAMQSWLLSADVGLVDLDRASQPILAWIHHVKLNHIAEELVRIRRKPGAEPTDLATTPRPSR